MENLLNIASYIYYEYIKKYDKAIDEMKFHKVMYFSQRESLIQTDKFLFDGTFYGWRYGPILKEIRTLYINNSFEVLKELKCNTNDSFNKIMNYVFTNYVPKDSWSLSMLSHNEISWKKSRQGIPDNVNGDNPIDNKDIILDAKRIREIRKRINQNNV